MKTLFIPLNVNSGQVTRWNIRSCWLFTAYRAEFILHSNRISLPSLRQKLASWPFRSDSIDDNVISVTHVALHVREIATFASLLIWMRTRTRSCLIQSSCTLVEEASDPPWPQRKCRKVWWCQPAPSLGLRQILGQCRRRRAYRPPRGDSIAALQSRNTTDRTQRKSSWKTTACRGTCAGLVTPPGSCWSTVQLRREPHCRWRCRWWVYLWGSSLCRMPVPSHQEPPTP